MVVDITWKKKDGTQGRYRHDAEVQTMAAARAVSSFIGAEVSHPELRPGQDPDAEAGVWRRLLNPAFSRRIVDRLQYRIWLRSGLRHVAATSGCFDIDGWHGDLTPQTPLSMRDESWQMVVVMRRR